jgi:hypothetical protein
MSTKKSIANETIEAAANLTEKSAVLALQTAVRSAEVAEGCVQGIYKAGYDANVDALKVAKNYWDAASEIRQDWLKLFASTGEKLIRAAANMELPLQKEAAKAAKSVISNIEKQVENIGQQAKAAAK